MKISTAYQSILEDQELQVPQKLKAVKMHLKLPEGCNRLKHRYLHFCIIQHFICFLLICKQVNMIISERKSWKYCAITMKSHLYHQLIAKKICVNSPAFYWNYELLGFCNNLFLHTIEAFNCLNSRLTSIEYHLLMSHLPL